MKFVDKANITRDHDLSAEELKSFAMFEQFTDEHAEEAINTIKTLLEIAFDWFLKEKVKQGAPTDF